MCLPLILDTLPEHVEISDVEISHIVQFSMVLNSGGGPTIGPEP